MMLSGETIAKLKQLAEDAAAKVGELADWFESGKGFIIDHFGTNGLYASYILVAALILFVVSRIAKLTFSTLKYLVLPSVGVALIGSFIVPYSFAALLPVTVTACSLVLLFKG